jgi:hypothetical protein|tara:strand:+ start:524 stop:667 length:144 start_codon:yes stop_codon:yes gene_type:complete
MVSDNEIIKYFLQTSKGVRATARYFGVSKIYASKVIIQYLKAKNIRL